MQYRAFVSQCLIAFLATLSLLACTKESSTTRGPLAYPATATVDQVDTYHGVQVADPYRWLEEDVRESDKVRQWVDAQNAVTFDYLRDIPERAAITARLQQLWDYEKYTIPVKRGGRYFYKYNDGLQNQYLLYTQETLDAAPELLIDPNTWAADATVALSAYYPSPDGRFLAYTIQDGGTDWRTARVMDLETRELLGEELEWLKFTQLAWVPDGSGFYYSRYPEPAAGAKHQESSTNQKVYYHRPGTGQDADELIYERPDFPEWNFTPTVTEDGRFLILILWYRGHKQQVAVAGPRAGRGPTRPVDRGIRLRLESAG